MELSKDKDRGEYGAPTPKTLKASYCSRLLIPGTSVFVISVEFGLQIVSVSEQQVYLSIS